MQRMKDGSYVEAEGGGLDEDYSNDEMDELVMSLMSVRENVQTKIIVGQMLNERTSIFTKTSPLTVIATD